MLMISILKCFCLKKLLIMLEDKNTCTGIDLKKFHC